MPPTTPHAAPDHTDLQSAWDDAISLGPAAQTEVLLALWARTGTAASSQRRLGDLALRFAHRLEATGVATLGNATMDDCDAFLWTRTLRNNSPSAHTIQLRRTALRDLYGLARLLDPDIGDPTGDLEAPPKPESLARALTTDELDLVRTAALGRIRRPLRAASIVAIAEATATTSELARARWGDLNLDGATIDLLGATPVKPRAGALTNWGVGVLRRTRQTLLPTSSDLIVGASNGASPYAAQAAMASFLARLLSSAGLIDASLRPSSIRLWGGARALADDGIEAAAMALGYDSLDATAAALDHRWSQR